MEVVRMGKGCFWEGVRSLCEKHLGEKRQDEDEKRKDEDEKWNDKDEKRKGREREKLWKKGMELIPKVESSERKLGAQKMRALKEK